MAVVAPIHSHQHKTNTAISSVASQKKEFFVQLAAMYCHTDYKAHRIIICTQYCGAQWSMIASGARPTPGALCPEILTNCCTVYVVYKPSAWKMPGRTIPVFYVTHRSLNYRIWEDGIHQIRRLLCA